MPPTRAQLRLAAHLRHPPAAAPAEATTVIAIKPHYAALIERGVKRVDFRRRFPKRFETGRAIFYVSSPVRAIAFVARIVAVERATPAALWRRFGDAGATGRAAFDHYFAGATTGVALVLDDVRPMHAPVSLADPRLHAIGFRPPQSLAVIPADSPLARLLAPRA